MSALSEAIAAAALPDGRPCSLPQWLGDLPVEMRAEVEAAIYDRKVEASTLSRALARLGYPITTHIIRRHRAGECRSCRRP